MSFVYRVFGRFAAALVLAAGLSVLGGAVILSSTAPALAQSNITVRGNSRIEADAVRAHFVTGPGERLDSEKIDEAVKNLYATGLFQDVSVTRSGSGLVVTVVENSVINRVAFEGNRKIKDAVLAQEVQSKSRGPFSQTLVQSDVQRILELYRRAGRYNATVEPQIISRPNGRVDLVFAIDEHDKSKITSIEFVGNEAYSDSRLRDEMTTTESNFLSWLKTSDVYDPDRVNADLELVRRFYLNHGYADFRVVGSEVKYNEADNSFLITVTVEEGPVYKFGTVDVESSVPDVKADQLRGEIQGHQGDVYSATDVEKTVEKMSIQLATSGYAFAQVRPRGNRDYESHTVSVTYSVEEGARVYVERINVRGNTRTRDYVVRREFDIAEGDAYNQALINRAERRLNRLGFFKARAHHLGAGLFARPRGRERRCRGPAHRRLRRLRRLFHAGRLHRRGHAGGEEPSRPRLFRQGRRLLGREDAWRRLQLHQSLLPRPAHRGGLRPLYEAARGDGLLGLRDQHDRRRPAPRPPDHRQPEFRRQLSALSARDHARPGLEGRLR